MKIKTGITIPVEVEFKFYLGEKGSYDHPKSNDEIEITAITICTDDLSGLVDMEELFDYYYKLKADTDAGI